MDKILRCIRSSVQTCMDGCELQGSYLQQVYCQYQRERELTFKVSSSLMPRYKTLPFSLCESRALTALLCDLLFPKSVIVDLRSSLASGA